MFSIFNSEQEYRQSDSSASDFSSDNNTESQSESESYESSENEEYIPSPTAKHVFTSLIDPKYAIDFLNTRQGYENIVVVFPYRNNMIAPLCTYRNDNYTSFSIGVDDNMVNMFSTSAKVQEYSVSDLVIDTTEMSALSMIPTNSKYNSSIIAKKTISAASIVRRRSLVVAFVSGSPMGCARLGEKFPDGFISTYRCAKVDFEVWILNEGLRMDNIQPPMFSVSSRIHLAREGENPYGSLPIPRGDNLYFRDYDFALQLDHDARDNNNHHIVNASIETSRNKYFRQVFYSGKTSHGHKTLMQIINFKHPEFFIGIEYSSSTEEQTRIA